MSRNRLAAVLLAAAFVLGPGVALAQFGSIFGAPPRPPGSVPNGRQQADPDTYPPPYGGQPPYSGQPQYGNQPPYGGQPPSSNPPPGSGRGGPSGAVQSQPLPPPSGAGDSNAPPQPTLSGLPPGGTAPGQRPPPPRGAPQPVDTTAQPDDQIVAEPPSQKIPNTSAMFSGLDKITGRIISFDVAIGETVQFGALQVTPRACYTRPPTETQNTDAFVEVDEVTLQGEVKRVFTGWMFAASPGLHGVEHAIYDVWLTNCKGAPQTVAATPPPDPTPPTRAQTPQRPPQPAQPRKPPLPTPPR
ncbi:MAG TPA: DUF2155 domain-containing protein [Xanthobacteraceae bacterium]|jgi:hypothetical protein